MVSEGHDAGYRDERATRDETDLMSHGQRYKLMHVVAVSATLRFFRGQLGYITDRGFDVSVVGSPDGDFGRMLTELSVGGHGVPIEREISPVRDLVSLYRLVKLFRSQRPDIVHGHTPKGGLLSMIAAWVARVPVRVYHIRGLRFVTTSGIKRRILMFTERLSCALAHRVIAVSKSVANEAIETGVCPREKITVLASGSGNGVDADGRFNPESIAASARRAVRRRHNIPEDAVVLGFVGRIVKDKGIVELAQAWRKIRDERPNTHLVLVGEFETGDPVPEEIQNMLAADKRVHLTGVVWDVPQMYSAFDLLVFPTYREGLPNVLLEAAAMALPVVATRVTGCVDAVLDGKTGTLVPVHDQHALAEAALAYIDSEVLRTAHGKAGRKWVLDNFRPEGVWKALAGEYAALVRMRI